nr:hypothetical protein [Tanacetum cinerariifolium]
AATTVSAAGILGLAAEIVALNMYLELVGTNVLEILHYVVELEVNFVVVEDVKIVLKK